MSTIGTFVLVQLGVLLLAFFGVVFPAVWSKKAVRRKEAFRVLDLLLRRRGPRR